LIQAKAGRWKIELVENNKGNQEITSGIRKLQDNINHSIDRQKVPLMSLKLFILSLPRQMFKKALN
jgi:hypothetical protein